MFHKGKVIAALKAKDVHGPYGYADDIWLCAWVADIVRREVGSDDILAQEADLIGDQRDQILRYTGCDRLINGV